MTSLPTRQGTAWSIASALAVCLAVLLSPDASAARVCYALTNNQAQPYTNVFFVVPASTNVLANGGVIANGPPIRVTPNADGLATNTLMIGHYFITNANFGNGILFRVTDSGTNTVYCATCPVEDGGLAISGFNQFVTVTYGTNPPPTYTEITNVLGFPPLSPTETTNAISNYVTSVTNQLATTNYVLTVGNLISNYAATLSTNATNFAKSLGVSTTNYAATLSTNATNHANAVGLAATNYALGIGLNATNLSLLLGVNSTNWTKTFGTNSTNFTLEVGVSLTNFVKTFGTNGSNYAATLATNATNWASTLATNGTNFAKGIGTSLTNLITTLSNAVGDDKIDVTNGIGRELLTIFGNLRVSTNLNVTNTATVGNLSVLTNAEITGNLTVAGESSVSTLGVNGTLTVTDAAEFMATAAFNQGLASKGNSLFGDGDQSSIDSSGNLSIGGTAGVTGELTAGTLTVTGASSLDDGDIATDGNGGIVAISLDLDSTLSVVGASSLDGGKIITDGNGRLFGSTNIATNSLQSLGNLSVKSNALVGSLVVTNSLTNNALTASRMVFSDANKALSSSAASSVVAASVPDKQGTGVLVFSSGSLITNFTIKTPTIDAGTLTGNSSLDGSLGVGGTMTFEGLTASRALQLDASGIITNSSVTTTELGYLSGVTSALQSQLNGKINTTDGIATNSLLVKGHFAAASNTYLSHLTVTNVQTNLTGLMVVGAITSTAPYFFESVSITNTGDAAALNLRSSLTNGTIASFAFNGRDASSNVITIATMNVATDDGTVGSTDGSFSFMTRSNGAATQSLVVTNGGIRTPFVQLGSTKLSTSSGGTFFNTVVSGVDPVDSSNLVTKAYADSLIAGVSSLNGVATNLDLYGNTTNFGNTWFQTNVHISKTNNANYGRVTNDFTVGGQIQTAGLIASGDAQFGTISSDGDTIFSDGAGNLQVSSLTAPGGSVSADGVTADTLASLANVVFGANFFDSAFGVDGNVVSFINVGSSFAATLPDADQYDGQRKPLFFMKRSDTSNNALTVQSGVGTVEGLAANQLLAYQSGLYTTDGTNWVNLIHTPKLWPKTTNYTVLGAETGSTYSNEGASAIVTNTLPAAATGLEFEFIVQDSDGMGITAVGDDTIRRAGTVSAAAGTITSTTVGSVIKLKAVNATQWIATSIVGTWSP